MKGLWNIVVACGDRWGCLHSPLPAWNQINCRLHLLQATRIAHKDERGPMYTLLESEP